MTETLVTSKPSTNAELMTYDTDLSTSDLEVSFNDLIDQAMYNEYLMNYVSEKMMWLDMVSPLFRSAT